MEYLSVVIIMASSVLIFGPIYFVNCGSTRIGPKPTRLQLIESRERLKTFGQHVELRLIKKDWMPNVVPDFEVDGALDESTFAEEDAQFIMERYESKYAYTPRSLSKGTDLFVEDLAGYKSNMDTIIIINPPSMDTDNFVQGTVRALSLRNFIRNYNIFTVDFARVSAAMDSIVKWSALGMGAYYNEFGDAIGSIFLRAIKNNILKAEQINIMGFCYSSHLAGYISRYIQRNGGGQIKSILGLDPFSVGLAHLFRTALSASDAEVVHIYHTNSAALGTFLRRGTADFVFNGGTAQPGCEKSPNPTCNHDRSMLFLWYVILYGRKFQARSCSNHFVFNFCFCQENIVRQLSYPPNKNVKGRFYLRTMREKPYGGGARGADCRSEAVKAKRRGE